MNKFLSLQERKVILFLLVFALLGLGVIGVKKIRSKPSKKVLVTGQERIQIHSADKKQEKMVLHIDGAVLRPGVYELEPGARLIDLVNMAGVTKDADLGRINLAQKIQDSQKVIINRKGEVLAGNDIELEQGFSQSGSGLININTAESIVLQTLPGIGPSFAQQIINYRQQNGPFSSPEGLRNISGIGERRFEAIKDLIVVK